MKLKEINLWQQGIPLKQFFIVNLIDQLYLNPRLPWDFKVWVEKNEKLIRNLSPKWVFSHEVDGWGLSYLDFKFQPIKLAIRKSQRAGEMTLRGIIAKLMPKADFGQLIDATGGLLGDTFELLGTGLSLRTYEAHPLLSLWIQLELLRDEPLLDFKFIAETFTFSELSQAGPNSVVVYDPMFELAPQSALPTKEMQVLRKAQEDYQVGALSLQEWQQWREVAAAIVVKRALKAAPLFDQDPTFCVKTKLLRWDIYKR